MGKRDRNLVNIPTFKERRRHLRSNPTPAESVLWSHLQRRQILGKKFRRQFGLGRYIVDFFCPECDLVIELDGAPHLAFFAGEYDFAREQYLKGLGIRVLRFQNREVFRNLEGVLETIREAMKTKGRSVEDRS